MRIFNAVKHVLIFNARYTRSALGQDNLLEIAALELDTTTTDFEHKKHELR